MTGPQGILDTDLYKLTMQQAVCMFYPRADARYSFINRGETPFPHGFGRELEGRVREMSRLRLTRDEKAWLAEECTYFSPVYLDFLEGYRFDPAEVRIEQAGGELAVTVEGPWYRTILWEVPLMALISELYFELTGEKARAWPEEKVHEINQHKARFFREHGIYFIEFGTRRRFSYRNHERLIPDLMQAGEYLLGTSNVHLARLYGIAPIGTQAHEWFQFHSARYGFLMANQMAPGKRPVTSMAPVIVFDAQGHALVAGGSAGGGQIVDYVARSLIEMLWLGRSPAQVLAAGHVSTAFAPRVQLEAGTARAALADGLRALGHDVVVQPLPSGAGFLQRVPGGWIGAADPRRDGVALGQ